MRTLASAAILAVVSATTVIAADVRSSKAQEVQPNMLFTALATPCRVFSGQVVLGAQTKDFSITGASDMTAQGGPATGCGVPAYAQAVSINLTAGASSVGGSLTAFPAGAPRPRITSLSYKTNAATAGSIVPLTRSGKISIYASAATRVSGDITGYFAAQMWAIVRPDGQLYMSASRLKSSRRLSTGVYEVTADREIHVCGAVASAVLQNYYATAVIDLPAKDYVTVKVYDPAGQLVDAPFTVMVNC